jgi:hypothetical protein
MDSNGVIRGTGRQRLKNCNKTPEYLLRNIHNPPRLLVGACSSFSPRVVRCAGDLDGATLIEDTPLTLRASVMGGVEFLDEILVSYRVGSSTWLTEQNTHDITLEQRLAKRMRLARAQRTALRQIHNDFTRMGRSRLAGLAQSRVQAKDLMISVLNRDSVPFRHRITIACRSRQWREVLVDATLYSIPSLAGLAMLFKRLIRRIGAK